MRKSILKLHVTTFAVIVSITLYSQDILKLKKGDEMKVVVVTSVENKIEYKSFFLQEGASLFVDKKDVSYIQYADGRKEYFEPAPTAPVSSNYTNATPPTNSNGVGLATELTNSLAQLSNRVNQSSKNQDAQNKAMLELLNSINNNILALKASLDRKTVTSSTSNSSESSSSKYIAPANNNSNSNSNYSEPQRSSNTGNTSNSNLNTGNNYLQEPELENIPYQFKNGEYVFFERVEGSLDNKMKGLYGGSETYISAFGLRSSVRFQSSALPKVYVKFDSKGDPSEKIWLLKATVTKDRRRFLCSSMSLTGAARDASSSRIEVQFKKINDTFYEILIPYLQTGEYTFTSPISGVSVLSGLTGSGGGRSSKLSCFGID